MDREEEISKLPEIDISDMEADAAEMRCEEMKRSGNKCQ
jgi:hypothetical protein